jgi:hypothetical protein
MSPSFRALAAKHNVAATTQAPAGKKMRSDLATGDTIKIYDMGRSVDPRGNLVEAHKVYTKVEDGHWNLGTLFNDGRRTDGGATPPTYHARPQSDELTDALNRARQAEAEALAAKQQIEDAARLVTERAQSDNAAGQQIADLVTENQRLKQELAQRRLDAGFGAKPQPAAATQTQAIGNNETPEFQDPAETSPLANWGKKVQ